MTAAALPIRPPAAPVRSAGPCGSGTVPGEVTKPCGVTEDTQLYPGGILCPAHKPINRKTGRRDEA